MLSQNFLFALYSSNDDSNFRKKCSFGSKNESYQKATNKQGWKLSKGKFLSKLNIQNSAYIKPLNLEL